MFRALTLLIRRSTS